VRLGITATSMSPQQEELYDSVKADGRRTGDSSDVSATDDLDLATNGLVVVLIKGLLI
jgi:hypothetical protein